MAGFRLPGPIGTGEGSDVATADVDEGTQPRMAMPAPGPVRGAAGVAAVAALTIDDDTRQLAATAYGEGSSQDVYEEMAAIANVLVRQQLARGKKSVGAFIRGDKTFAFAAHDGNSRYTKLNTASAADIGKDAGMAAALKGAQNALAPKAVDLSNGAYFWDGADIKSNYAKHPKVRAGIRFGDPAHNIYGILAKDVPGENFWIDKHGKQGKSRGKWTCKFESTAAYGGTIFWKYTAEFLKATGNKEYD